MSLQEENQKQPSIITFNVGDEEFAADGNQVVSIIPIQEVIQKKGLTFDVKFNLPEEVAQSLVVDMHEALQIPRTEINPQARLLIVESHNLRFAFMVDSVNELRSAEGSGTKSLDIQSVSTRGEAVVCNAMFKDELVHLIDFDQIVREEILKPKQKTK